MTDRKDALLDQRRCVEIRPVAGAVADFDIRGGPLVLDRLGRRGDLDRDGRMAAAEIVEPRSSAIGCRRTSSP